jgi:exopolysaccharide production protein ExoQ
VRNLNTLSIQERGITFPSQHMATERSKYISIWHLLLGWVLIVPMLYISGDGAFVPRTGDVAFAATGGSPGTSGSHKIALALFCLVCLMLIAFRSSAVFALGRRTRIILAFPILAILSCIWSGDPWQSIASGVVLLIFTVFAIYVGSQLSFQRQFELIMMVGAIVLPASIALAIFVPSIGTESSAWRGVLVSKQNCAAVCTLLLITALHWKCSGIYQRIFRAMSIVMCGLLIVMSQSRTGWALAVVSLVLAGMVWLLQRMPRKQAMAILLPGFAVAVVAMFGIQVYSSRILALVGKDSTLSQRTIIWAAAWQAALQHPILGYGFASFWKGLYGPSQNVVLTAGWGLAQSQNGFLDVWLGIGLVGVALIAAITGQAMLNAVQCLPLENNQTYVRWCIVVILCTLIFNIGESSIGLFRMTWFLFLLACIGLNQATTVKNR